MNSRLILALLFIFFLTGCSLFSDRDNTIKVVAGGFSPKELYEKAEDKVDSGLIEDAINQYKIILASYPNSKYAIQARLDIAYNLFKQKKYNRSIIELNQFIEKYPDIASTPYAYYLRAVVAENKSTSILDDLITDNAQRDVESVKEAYKYYISLIYTFPNSKYTKDAKNKLSNLRNTLARHEFYVAIYYSRIGAYIASINRSKYIIENYQNSEVTSDALHLMAYNYDIISADQLAIDARKVLASNYPSYSPNYSIK